MFRAVCAAVLAVHLIAAAQAAPTVASASFNIKMPCKEPVRQTDASGKLTLTCAVNGAYYALTIDVAQQGVDPDAIYDPNIDSLANALNGTMRLTMPITANGLEGRETLFDVPTQHAVARSRYFVAWGLFYALTYYGSAGTENSKAAADFLNSFRVKY